jgi:hypothetical protein
VTTSSVDSSCQPGSPDCATGTDPNNPNPNDPNDPNNPNNPNNPHFRISAVLTASPTSIAQGAYSVLSWFSQNASSCTGDNFLTLNDTSGTKQVNPLFTTLYTLTCTNAAGQRAFSTATVNVSGPVLSITATPQSIRKGDSTTVRWSVTGLVDSCSVSGPGLSSDALSGSQQIAITAESTYTLLCHIANAPSKSVSTTVKVLPSFIEQ